MSYFNWLEDITVARLPGHHLSARAAHHRNGRLRGLDGQVATDDRRALSSERHGSRAAHAAARARDDAHFSCEPRWHSIASWRCRGAIESLNP
jgi:hypothetical protein